MKQKYNKLDICLVNKGEYEGQEVMILASYNELYGSGNTNSYSIRFMETGFSMSWMYDEQLTLIRKGTIEELSNLDIMLENHKANVKTKGYILEHLDKEGISSGSILHLFDLLGFESKFHKNGEFYCLYSEFDQLRDLFIYISKAKSIDEFKKDAAYYDGAVKVFNFFHS